MYVKISTYINCLNSFTVFLCWNIPELYLNCSLKAEKQGFPGF